MLLNFSRPKLNKIRRLVLGRFMSMTYDKEERGLPTSTTPPGVGIPDDRANQDDILRAATTSPSVLIPVDDKLANFRVLTGIDSAPALTIIEILKRPAPNLGIYNRTVRAEQTSGLQFRVFSILINGCLGAQIVVAAALTALGAGNGPHGAVTAFGAINTVIAGFLTYLKGSGLPNRLKYYENEWTKVREYIEQRERDFGREACTLDLEEEIRTVERMYEDVRQDMETNTPDHYTSMTEARRKRGIQPAPPIAKYADESRRGDVSDAGHLASARSLSAH